MIFLVLYTTLWFFRSLEFSYFLVKTYRMSRFYLNTDWYKLLHYFSPHSTLTQDIQLEHRPKRLKFLHQIRNRIQEQVAAEDVKQAEEIYHILVMATYKEDVDILRTSLAKVTESQYDLTRVFLILAGEERDRERATANAQILEQEFAGKFGGFYFSLHPENIPGEIKGKGSNITYAAKSIIPAIVDRHHLDPSNVLVTTLDADNCVHPFYLANLTFHYLLSEDRGRKAYQPLPLFYNNIWDVPIFNRIVAFSSSFWHMIESGRPDRLRNFSSHAQSLDALYLTDFWSTQTIVEDGHQYWRSYFAFQGNYAVVPLFIPIYQDAVQNENYTKTLYSQYKQLRRWAWGCSDIPYVIKKMREDKHKIPFWNRFANLARLMEGHYMWATAPIIVTLTMPIPRMINSTFEKTIMSYNMGVILSNFFAIAMVGVFLAIWISMLMAPPHPKSNKFTGIWLKISAVLQWFLLPFTTILFGALPAIEAQTRLMFAKYLDFNVTEKIRRPSYTPSVKQPELHPKF